MKEACQTFHSMPMSKLFTCFLLVLTLVVQSCDYQCLSGRDQVTIYNNSDLELYVEVLVDGTMQYRNNIYMGDYDEISVPSGVVTVRTKESGSLFQPNYQMVSYTANGCASYNIHAHSVNSWANYGEHYLELDRNM